MLNRLTLNLCMCNSVNGNEIMTANEDQEVPGSWFLNIKMEIKLAKLASNFH